MSSNSKFNQIDLKNFFYDGRNDLIDNKFYDLNDLYNTEDEKAFKKEVRDNWKNLLFYLIYSIIYYSFDLKCLKYMLEECDLDLKEISKDMYSVIDFDWVFEKHFEMATYLLSKLNGR